MAHSTLSTPSSQQGSKPSIRSALKNFIFLFSRFWMTICTLIFFQNTYYVFFYRFSTESMENLVKIAKYYAPHYTEDANIATINYSIQNRWLGQHVWPVPLWLILMFVQLSTYVRRKYLNLHRIFGRIALLLTLLMGVTVLLMIITKEDMYGPLEFSFDLSQPSKVFSFRSGSLIYSIYWLYCLYKTYTTVKRKNIDEHKFWALQLAATGFGSGSTRVCLLIYVAFCKLFIWEKGYQMNSEELSVVMGYCGFVGFTGGVLLLDLMIAFGLVDAGKKWKNQKTK